MPTTTVIEYARMANAVYDSNPRVEGWTRMAFQPSGRGLTQAFQGAAFRKGSEIVFAFKGTSGGRDLVADVKLGAGMNTHQYASALKFVGTVLSLVPGDMSVCGHSLGGAIAQIVGNRLRLPFVTFNAPGVGLVSRNLGEVALKTLLPLGTVRILGAMGSSVLHPVQAIQDAGSMFHRVKGVNFRLGKDAIGCIGIHYGQLKEIPYDGGALDFPTKHRMASVLEALEKPKSDLAEEWAKASLVSLVG